MTRAVRSASMPFDTLLLMTPVDYATLLTQFLAPHAEGRSIRPLTGLDDLDSIANDELLGARLISFANPVIVPEDILTQLGYGAYNFHPGPPHFPGVAPAQMAIYHDASLFGITVHHMVTAVDAGPIAFADLCLVPPDATPLDLEVRAFALLTKAFNRLAPHLAQNPAPLPALPFTWGRSKSSRRQIAELCAMTPDLPPDEIDRRIRAFAGNGFGIDVTIEIGGHRFCLSGSPKPELTVAVAGAA